MTWPHYELLGRIYRDLKQAKAGSVLPVDALHLADVLPHYWREESDSPEEWFIRMCRGLGMHATYDALPNKFRVTLTRDAEHEATITWPGKESSVRGGN